MQSDGVNLYYFKLRLFDLTEFIQHWVAKILGLKNQSLWQKLNSFAGFDQTQLFINEWDYKLQITKFPIFFLMDESQDCNLSRYPFNADGFKLKKGKLQELLFKIKIPEIF